MCTCIADSLCHTVETNRALQSNYTTKKKLILKTDWEETGKINILTINIWGEKEVIGVPSKVFLGLKKGKKGIPGAHFPQNVK